MTTHDDVKAWNVAAVGGISALLVLVLVLAVQVLYYHADARLEAAKEGPGSPPELAAFVSHEEALLSNGYAWRPQNQEDGPVADFPGDGADRAKHPGRCAGGLPVGRGRGAASLWKRPRQPSPPPAARRPQ